MIKISKWYEDSPNFDVEKMIEYIRKEVDELLDEYNDFMTLYELFGDEDYKELALFTKQTFMRRTKHLASLQEYFELKNK